MGSDDRADNRTLMANFTPEGVALLTERVNEKLKELLGEYADDMLVVRAQRRALSLVNTEYVIGLLRNGRDKEQAKNVLDVILGDECDSFVSWLYDHLALNIDLYVEPKELKDEAPKRKLKLISEVQAGGDGFQQLNSQSEREKSSKLSRSRRNKGWKGLVGREAEAPALCSFVVKSSHVEVKTQSKADHGLRSPLVRKKRGRADEKQKTKRHLVSQVNIDAPRRLLQFAVRDAVASNSGTAVERSLKRLRSVVSASSGELVEQPQRMQTVSRVANPNATMIEAVAGAAEDVIKVKSSRSVLNQLDCAMNPSDGSNQLEDHYQCQEQSQLLYLQRDKYSVPYTANVTMLEHETGFHSEETSDNEGFGEVSIMGRTGVSQFGSSGGKMDDDSLMVNYCIGKNADDGMHLKWHRDQEQPAAAHSTAKIVNISVNVNTWKTPGPPKPGEVAELDAHETLDSEIGAPKSSQQTVKENAKAVKVSDGNANPASGLKKGSQKAQLSTSGSGAAVCQLEDADSRTIFASNVHFAATKDALSRHFSKFGKLLKVIVVTDVTTGQPKGAAYVEFMQKQAADNALTLDGTSFMSRILKVVRKSAAHQESAPAMPWPRIARESLFPSARFSRVPFSTASTGTYRTWPPTKLGARSFQWKRDAQGTSTENGASSNNSGISASAPAARGLTYVRTESKLKGSSGT